MAIASLCHFGLQKVLWKLYFQIAREAYKAKTVVLEGRVHRTLTVKKVSSSPGQAMSPGRIPQILQPTTAGKWHLSPQRAVSMPFATSREGGLGKTQPKLTLALFGLITLAFRSKTVGESYFILSWRYMHIFIQNK